MKILDLTRPLDHASATLKLSADELTTLEEALGEFLRELPKHKAKAEYYGEAFATTLEGLRDQFKHILADLASRR